MPSDYRERARRSAATAVEEIESALYHIEEIEAVMKEHEIADSEFDKAYKLGYRSIEGAISSISSAISSVEVEERVPYANDRDSAVEDLMERIAKRSLPADEVWKEIERTYQQVTQLPLHKGNSMWKVNSRTIVALKAANGAAQEALKMAHNTSYAIVAYQLERGAFLVSREILKRVYLGSSRKRLILHSDELLVSVGEGIATYLFESALEVCQGSLSEYTPTIPEIVKEVKRLEHDSYQSKDALRHTIRRETIEDPTRIRSAIRLHRATHSIQPIRNRMTD
ncbi:MAG: hypothetical protein OXH96_16990 [Spirochaetaceae bacterium]|nr:hypothetical protein [Spirochaetaceae bacterium]